MIVGPFTDLTDAIKLWKKFRYFKTNYWKMTPELHSEHVSRISKGVAKQCIFLFDLLIILGLFVYVSSLQPNSIMSVVAVSLAVLVITFSWALWSKTNMFFRKFLSDKYPNVPQELDD